MITQERLKELFNYDPETGWFTHRVQRGPAKAGKRAGAIKHGVYREITADYKKYYEHHMAYLYVYGEVPAEIDHIDGDASNNRIANLRPCSRGQNNCNRLKRPTGVSGLRGAYLNRRTHTWFSQIQFGRKVKYLGAFPTAEKAHEAFEEAAKQLHGEYYFP